MAGVSRGPVKVSLSRDDESHREYQITYLVETSDPDDGPLEAARSSGLPAIGATWAYGNDVDLWAFCMPYTKVTPVLKEGEQRRYWHIEKKFSTIPLKRCQTAEIANPLLEPQKISGSFTDGKKKTSKDKDGNSIQTTSFEPILVETADTLPTVRIEQNVLALGLSTFTPMIQTVNNATLWGLGARRIRLAGASWERKYYGSCTVYYTRVFDFEVNFGTFDRSDIPNKGRKLIRGEWNDSGAYVADGSASASDPRDYITGIDKNGNPTEHYLAADGTPSDVETFISTVQLAAESNFLLLGIPTSL